MHSSTDSKGYKLTCMLTITTTTTTTSSNLFHCLPFPQLSGPQLAPFCWLESYSERAKESSHCVSAYFFWTWEKQGEDWAMECVRREVNRCKAEPRGLGILKLKQNKVQLYVNFLRIFNQKWYSYVEKNKILFSK